MQMIKDGWALALFALLGWLGYVFLFPARTKQEPIQPIIQQQPVQPIQYREPETRTVYVPQPQYPQPSQPAPPINISIVIDGEQMTPIKVEQGEAAQKVITPKTNVTQSHPCDDLLNEHNERVAKWQRDYATQSQNWNGRVQQRQRP